VAVPVRRLVFGMAEAVGVAGGLDDTVGSFGAGAAGVEAVRQPVDMFPVWPGASGREPTTATGWGPVGSNRSACALDTSDTTGHEMPWSPGGLHDRAPAVADRSPGRLPQT
jgi:hypothetical protein